MNIETLIEKVELWGKDRNLIKPENEFKQFIKSVEEIGETGKALLKNDIPGFKDGIGDVLVTLIILCKQKNINIIECLEIAYIEIEHRTGKTINGTFIKDTK